MQEIRPLNTVQKLGYPVMDLQCRLSRLLNMPGLLTRFGLVIEPVIRWRHADRFNVLNCNAKQSRQPVNARQRPQWRPFDRIACRLVSSKACAPDRLLTSM